MLEIILSSALISGTLSALISYFVSLHLKKKDFQNEYFKEILKKRLAAYEHIELQIAVLKTTVLDEDDGRPFTLAVAVDETEFQNFQKDLSLAMTRSLWIDENTVHALEDLNSLLYRIENHVRGKSASEIMTVAKDFYREVSKTRQNLEVCMKKGLYNLHDMKKAFKNYDYSKKRNIYNR